MLQLGNDIILGGGGGGDEKGGGEEEREGGFEVWRRHFGQMNCGSGDAHKRGSGKTELTRRG